MFYNSTLWKHLEGHPFLVIFVFVEGHKEPYFNELFEAEKPDKNQKKVFYDNKQFKQQLLTKSFYHL